MADSSRYAQVRLTHTPVLSPTTSGTWSTGPSSTHTYVLSPEGSGTWSTGPYNGHRAKTTGQLWPQYISPTA